MDQYKIGQDIFVQGTGNWWQGVFKAQVVDIRESDNTIKIRYQDGGYKRLQYNQLQKITVTNEKTTQSVPLKSYELDYEMIDSLKFQDSLQQQQLIDAVQNRQFELAQQIKDKIQQKKDAVDNINALNIQIQQAAYQSDFKKADELNKQIPKLQQVLQEKQQIEEEEVKANWREIINKSFNRALGGGIAGACAMAIQVVTLMWMRTTMNYQYRYGTTTRQAFKALYAQGGIPRFYKGILPGLFQGPLSRFGDTFSNTGVMTLMNSNKKTKDLPISVKTLCSSFSAATFRIFLMPIDTVKTIMQVEGKDGISKLKAKIAARGPQVFYHGSIGASAATFAGHYPWFFTYNFLDSKLPLPTDFKQKLARSALLGFCSSAVSDTLSNSIRVLKTYKQTTTENISYPEIAKKIIKEDGLMGLFGRGLQTRIIANGMQGLMFSVMWKYFDEQIQNRNKSA